MDAIMVERIKALLAEIFQVSLGEVSANLAFGDLPQWDSMGHMDVMMSLEEHFGVEINADTIGELISIPAIYAYLAEKSNHG